MAIDLVRIADTTPTSAVLLIRATASGAVTVSGALSASAVADTAVRDGIVQFDFSGLTPATEYAVVVEQAGNRRAMRIKTPAQNPAHFRICVFSCQLYDPWSQRHWPLIAAKNPDYTICDGDLTYADISQSTLYGRAAVKGIAQYNYAGWLNAFCQHEQVGIASVQAQEFMARHVLHVVTDDHVAFGGCDGILYDASGNITAGSIRGMDQYRVNVASFPGATGHGNNPAVAFDMTDVINMLTAARDSQRYYHYTPNVGRVIGNNKYWSRRIGNIAHVCVLDCISERSAGGTSAYSGDVTHYATNDPAKKMLSDAQLAALYADLDAAEIDGIPNKIIISGKKTLPYSNEVNTDGWEAFEVQWAAISAHIYANYTGVSWVCGDRHSPGVIWDESIGHLAVVPCPGSQTSWHDDDGLDYPSNVIWMARERFGNAASSYHVYGVIDIDASGVTYEIRDVDGDRVLERVRALPGTPGGMLDRTRAKVGVV